MADFGLAPPAPAPLTGLPAGVEGAEEAAEAGLGVPRSPGVRLEAIWVTGAVLLLVALSCGLSPGVLGLSESGAVTDCFRGCFLVLSVAEAEAGELSVWREAEEEEEETGGKMVSSKKHKAKEKPY